jgi:hypothetical protein
MRVLSIDLALPEALDSLAQEVFATEVCDLRLVPIFQCSTAKFVDVPPNAFDTLHQWFEGVLCPGLRASAEALSAQLIRAKSEAESSLAALYNRVTPPVGVSTFAASTADDHMVDDQTEMSRAAITNAIMSQMGAGAQFLSNHAIAFLYMCAVYGSSCFDSVNTHHFASLVSSTFSSTGRPGPLWMNANPVLPAVWPRLFWPNIPTECYNV